MEKRRAGQFSIRPIQENRKRLDEAVAMGFEMAPLINELIAEKWDEFIEQKKKQRLAELEKQKQLLQKSLARSR